VKALITPKKPRATPPERKAELCDAVIDGMQGGLSCFKACKAAGVSHSTFLMWVGDDAELANKYTRAREDLLERMASDLIDIADRPVGSTDSGATDSGAVADKKVQIDTRKWLLSKLAPKKYGEKLEVSGDAANPIAIQRIERVIVK
jgi:hypothetical protein